MAQARVEQGWIRVPYDGPELTLIEIGVAGIWHAAFLDWDAARNRVAQIRIPPVAGQVPVRVRADGITTDAGTITIGGPS